MFKLFTSHPDTVGETYVEHLLAAGGFSWRLAAASLMCAVHALLPFLFEKTASRMVAGLHHRMVTARDQRSPARSLTEASADV